MDKEGLKEGLRKEVLEMVERVWAKMPDSLRAFREVERAVVEATGELRAKVLQSWCEEARDDCLRPLCPHCGGKMRQKEQRDKRVVCHGGDVVVKRKRWWCEKCGESFFPSGRGGDGGRTGNQP